MKSKYRMIFFDNDGTLTTYRNTWNYTHQFLGTWEPHGRELLEYHLKFKTPYDEFSRESVKLWKGVPRSKFLDRLMTIPIRDGIRDIYAALHNTGIKTGVLSSGFSLWKEVWKIREGFEWEHYYANDLIFDSNNLCTGEISMNVTDNVPGMNKGDWVEKISRIEGIEQHERIFVGDGWGDVAGFQKCAFGVGVDPDDETRPQSKYVLEDGEFIKLLDIIFHE